MKGIFVSIIIFLVTISSFADCSAAPLNTTQANKTFTEIGKHILLNLSKTKNQGGGFDYWPDGGIRIAYDHLRTFTSYQNLVKLSPVPLFIKGPHNKLSLDLRSNTSFGYYNPAFIDWLKLKMSEILSSSEFVNRTKPQFKKYLAKTALVYWDTYHALQKWPAERDKLLEEYVSKIQQGELPEGYYYNIAWNGDKKYQSLKTLFAKHNVNVVAPAVYFWLRRKIDSTDEKVRDLLAHLLKSYGVISL